MKKTDVKEISELYDQLLQYSTQVNDLTKHATTVTGGILAVAFAIGKAQGAIIAILPIMILIPLYVVVLNRKINMVRIATYIRTFADPNWQYERRLHIFRNFRTKKKLDNKLTSYEFGINGMFITYGIVSITCSFLIAIIEKGWWFLFIPLISMSILWIIYKYQSNKLSSGGMWGEYEKQCFDIWVAIAETEPAHSSNNQDPNEDDKASY